MIWVLHPDFRADAGSKGEIGRGTMTRVTSGSGGAVSDLTRPGVLPLRPLTTGELLDGAIAVLRTRPGRLVGLGALLAVLEQLMLYPLRSLSDQDISLLPASASATCGSPDPGSRFAPSGYRLSAKRTKGRTQADQEAGTPSLLTRSSRSGP